MKSVLLKGKSLLEDTARLGTAVETAVFKHHNVRHFRTSGTLSWWRGGCGEHEVDFVEESPDGLMPFEVKCTQEMVQNSDLKGMAIVCGERKFKLGCIITRDMGDIGLLALPVNGGKKSEEVRIPALLACWWLSQSQIA